MPISISIKGPLAVRPHRKTRFHTEDHDKFHAERPIQDAGMFEKALVELCNAKNALSRHAGYSPEIIVLGKPRRLPGSIIDEDPQNADFENAEGTKIQQQTLMREAARIAFVRTDHCSSLRKALHARSRPHRMKFAIGDWVMYWKDSKTEPGKWLGPARILMTDRT